MLKTIALGSAGELVFRLQSKLKLDKALNHTPVDGVFGPGTLKDVRTFQAAAGLAVDGIVGPKTWAALGFERGYTREFRSQPWRTEPIRRIVLHHTITASIDVAVYVLKLRGMSTHYLLDNGRVEHVCDDNRVAWHAKGHNDDSIGVDVVNLLDYSYLGHPDNRWREFRRAPWAPRSDARRYLADLSETLATAERHVKQLCEDFNIPFRWPSRMETLPDAETRAPGIYAHGHLSNNRWDGFAVLEAWGKDDTTCGS